MLGVVQVAALKYTQSSITTFSASAVAHTGVCAFTIAKDTLGRKDTAEGAQRIQPGFCARINILYRPDRSERSKRCRKLLRYYGFARKLLRYLRSAPLPSIRVQ